MGVRARGEPGRYPKAGTPNADVRVGVVSVNGGRTQWLDFGEIRDHLLARIHWTPDSKSVVAHRLNRVQDHLWILSADAVTGVAKVLIEEKSESWINVTDDFRILGDGRIPVSYTHLRLPTSELVSISVVAVSLNKQTNHGKLDKWGK